MAGGGATVRNSADGHNSGSGAGGEPYFRILRSKHADAMLHGLNALRCADKLFDVTFIVEERRFKAHRTVLAACSDYFCAMFTDAMREASQSEIQLNGVSARGIELLLEYAYTSKLELDLSNVEDVLSVSTHVQMKAVIDACSDYLETQIDLENCVAIASLADLYSLESLKKEAFRYICSRLDEFAHSPDFVNLTCDQLEQILSCNYPVDCSEERVLQITIDYCLDMKLTAEQARLLFSKVRFNQIGACALNAITIDAKQEDEKSPVNFYNYEALHQAMRAEIQMQEQRLDKVRLKNADAEEVISADILTNSRGMEMALVKIGGFETNGLTNQISCYLPSKGKWETLTVIPHIDQCNYGTAVLGNDLYVVGGSYDVCLKEYIHPFGFRYCPTKDKWNTIAPIQADRCRFSLNAMGNNFLYAVGGVCELNENDGIGEHWPHDAQDQPVSNCERYNASEDRWEYLPALSENRSQHAGVVLDTNLFISGGIDRHIVLASLWCFDTKKSKWNKLSPMPTPRADHILIAFDKHIYACGGWYEDPLTETRVLAETIDVYDIVNDQWTTETQNPMPKYYTGVASMKRKIYFMGGLLSTATINRATSAVQCYDLETKEWSFNSEWEYPKEVWECTCAAFYVPRDRYAYKFLENEPDSDMKRE